jgi:hypothetical protein
VPRRSRCSREVPPSPAFKAYRADHWLHRDGREREELEEELVKMRARGEAVLSSKEMRR